MKKLSFVGKLVLFVNSIFGLLLLLSYLSPVVDPNTISIFAYLGLAYLPLLLINALFIVYWVIRLKPQVLLSVICIAAGWSHLQNHIQWGNSTTGEEGIKIMSFNVRLFDLYNWSNNVATRNKIYNYITKEKADFLCFQEFYVADDKSYFPTLDTIKQFQQAKNIHVEYTKYYMEQHFGIATFSKYPIIGKHAVYKDTIHNICIATDVTIGKDTVRIYNMHLASIRLQTDDYAFIDDISNKKTDEQINGSKAILKRLQNAFSRRANQAQIVANHISQSPYKVVVCGDFNDTPLSYAYNTIIDGLTDTFVKKGSMISGTYNGLMSVFRIDHILVDPTITTIDYKRVKTDLSDHHPVVAEFKLNQ